jgi:hypothetical protein
MEQLWGRTFRDPEAQLIQHHIVPHSVYSAFIAAGPLRIDLDEAGYPVMAELSVADGICTVDSCLRPPIDFELGTVRFLDHPSRIEPVSVAVDSYNTLWHIRLTESRVAVSFQTVTGAIWEIDQESCICGLWFLRGQDDPYGRGRKSWRSRTWRRARRELILAGDARIISPISRGEES